jgi:hypothetical protein
VSSEKSTIGKGAPTSVSGGTPKRRYGCDTCRDWGTVSQVTKIGDGVILERAVPCPACTPRVRTRQRALDRQTNQVGVVMWSGVVLGPGGLVTKYALRPEAGGLEWSATDVELLDAPAPERQGRP